MQAQSKVSAEEVAAIEEAMRRAVSRALRPSLASYADDIVQAAMERLIARMQADPSAKPRTKAYVWRMANHAVIDQVRKLQRRREDLGGDNEEVAVTGDPDAHARRRELGAAITDCVDRLNDDRRRVVTLYLMGHGVTEAAGILDWPRKRVDNAVYRGLADVRKCLEQKGVAP